MKIHHRHMRLNLNVHALHCHCIASPFRLRPSFPFTLHVFLCTAVTSSASTSLLRGNDKRSKLDAQFDVSILHRNVFAARY
ncbi:hypothetical protein K437DRAFT_139188 [Tilletiaria anomala UBC 951]|uniref:Uncharacterized protein n=1 Tax=Tilletiaria anomala (strain ATCC 24038 / CBS 436.72 / UBC 951) TaxID=1037660 RepID=A0A066VSH4_TILAU|nr:uncharacterized protein K437DRAFT_139188 [Tilletiaria anomala UBC 951]KDN44391.1 hypothetical protein K437DRAFT_139188 [Tilletiaria anomala UBC 951]